MGVRLFTGPWATVTGCATEENNSLRPSNLLAVSKSPERVGPLSPSHTPCWTIDRDGLKDWTTFKLEVV